MFDVLMLDRECFDSLSILSIATALYCVSSGALLMYHAGALT
jgi:hypothetical protein